MIDDGKLQKSGKVDLKFKIEEYKKKREQRKEARAFYKQQRIDERQRKKHRKRIQTKEVRKRMKKNERAAKRINKNKPDQPFFVRLKWKIKKAYGRLH